LVACATASAGSARRSNDGHGSLLVIRGGTLIDGTGRPVLPNAVIVVRGNRIETVGESNAVTVPKGAQVIDAHGKFVLPGVIDCHCHMESIGFGDLAELPQEWQKPERLIQLVRINAQLDLLSGITTVRDLGSTGLLIPGCATKSILAKLPARASSPPDTSL
jgi:imidazolonepropionase-like amidohydrolase